MEPGLFGTFWLCESVCEVNILLIPLRKWGKRITKVTLQTFEKRLSRNPRIKKFAVKLILSSFGNLPLNETDILAHFS